MQYAVMIVGFGALLLAHLGVHVRSSSGPRSSFRIDWREIPRPSSCPSPGCCREKGPRSALRSL
jgi:hypothetical protein